MSKVREIMARRAAGEKGFTLVELLVVVVILVVLAAIAVPIFLNQANKAKESKAQSTVGAIANLIKNGQGVGDTVTIGASDLSYTGATGSQTIALSGATVTTAGGSASVLPSSTWCVSYNGGGSITYKISSTDSAPSAGNC